MFEGLVQLTCAPSGFNPSCRLAIRFFIESGTSMQTKVRIASSRFRSRLLLSRPAPIFSNRTVEIYEMILRVERLAALVRADAVVAAIGQQPPRLHVVAQADVEHLFFKMFLESRVFD